MTLRSVFPLMMLACSGDVAVEHDPITTFVGDTFTCDCMPAYPPDPLGAITMDYTAGDAPLEFETVAIYRFAKQDGTPTATVTRALSPGGSGLLTPRQHVTIVHVTVDTPGALAAACGMESATYALELDVTSSAGTRTFTPPPRSFMCSD